ncbi:MAG: 16S rRNA (guanine(966)-N(2))-methyltransferase RsmD [Chloroflexota bacterium]|nr:16S rRNA (guanine(966)-N(2))-methyltransferase RsmD [Chloroflexota bacterium]MDE2919548.1 16S rRNA (guanine(966)-N(2))-methyltransferase RsmD [Chloroflexota bacterium]
MAARGRGLTITAGVHRGRRLRVPPGIRPTTDRVRAAAFDALQGPPPERVLDLYAGSGAFGIEALSRGAGYACFIERSRRAASVIRQNLDLLDLREQGEVMVGDARRVALARGAPFGLVFADPPYADDPWVALFDALETPGVLTNHALVVTETSSRIGAPLAPFGWRRLKERRHGDSTFAVFVREATLSNESRLETPSL